LILTENTKEAVAGLQTIAAHPHASSPKNSTLVLSACTLTWRFPGWTFLQLG